MIFVGRTALSVEIITKSSTLMLIRQHRQIISADNVIADRLETILFHHWHVFIRRRMKDHLWLLFSKNFFQSKSIEDVADHRQII